MIEGIKPYPEYKSSGSRWLKDVPSSWEVHSLRTLIRHRNKRNRPDLPLLSVAREKGVFVRSLTGGDDNHNAIPEDLSNYKVAEAGDLVINKMKAWQGSLGVAPCDGIVSPAYFVFDIRLENARFAQTLLRSKPYVAHFGQASDGVRVGQWDLSIAGMREIPVLVPSPEEQAAIVRFLDHVNGKIERAIRAKKRLIALLNEQKQVIIHRAVTRGLDPNAPLKPSGIPWLGEIPAHWEIRRLRTLITHIDQGVSPIAGGRLSDRTAWGVLKSGCVNGGTFRDTEHKQLPSDFEIDPDIVVKPGDVLVSRACGSTKYVGSVAKVEQLRFNLILCDKTFRLKFRDEVDVDYMVLTMNSRYYRSQVEQAISGAEGMANNLPVSSLRTFVFVLPPSDEARQIFMFVQDQSASMNCAIRQAESEIRLLTEYRTRLVSDIVTGKLDVREAAAKLPAASDDPLPPATEDLLDEEDPTEDLDTPEE